MVNIVTKVIKGNEYLYLVESIRDGNKVIQKTVKYIGRKRPIAKEEFECMKLSYKSKDWILAEFSDFLSYQDHEEMSQASINYHSYQKNLDSVSKEKERERFLSQFISNSSAIEGSSLDVKDTFNLLFNDLTPKGKTKKELYMATNMLAAWEYLEANFKRFPTGKDLCELHGLVNKDIESKETLGKYKKIQNYVGDIYTTSFLFAEERTEKLLAWIKEAYSKIDDFEVAFQSHAQFEIIHPFIDGNGRVGRLLINWLLMHKGLSPLAIRVSKRDDYLSALLNSQRGKVEAISRFCYREYINQYRFV
jgi:Fic family protein